MNFSGKNYKHVLLTGSGNLTAGIAVCLLRSGHTVTLYPASDTHLPGMIAAQIQTLEEFDNERFDPEHLTVADKLTPSDYELVIAITDEDLKEKRTLISLLEDSIESTIPLAINFESFSLEEITSEAGNAGRIIGMNWSEPAYNTFFLEIIADANTDQRVVDELFSLARSRWQKDPYLLQNGRGIRSRMLCALIREAFYLVKNDYVRVEDIDRACRNDAGYYLPFAGNFRYMDLMGAYMYGIVMQDLNPELSKDTEIPDFCRELFKKGHTGMKAGKGFYAYENGEAEEWEKKFSTFSHEIKQVISKYHLETVPAI